MGQPERKPRFPYVLFDLGSTLIYFDGDWSQVMPVALLKATQELRSLGHDLDEEAFPEAYYELMQTYYQKRADDNFLEYTSDHVLKQALRAHSVPDPSPEHLRQALDAFYKVTQQYWHREPDAVPMLEALRARGCRLGIISNASDDEDVQALIDKTNLRPYFDFILTSAVAGVRKPNPKIFEQALNFWGARPEQVVMVGDLVDADVVGANQLGMASVWIPRRADTPENRAAAASSPPDAVINALSELPGVLESWI
jgi:HAD superfamily hydrolase (TIGR01662 family)